MKKWLLILAGAIVLGLVASSVALTRPAFDDAFEGVPLDGLSVLPLEKGLTFARVVKNGGTRLVIVRSVSADGLRVIDISAALSQPVNDPLAAVASMGLEQLEHLARTGEEEPARYEDLGVPLLTGSTHIAAGTNYAAHAKETGIEDGVFLFPKLSAPTAWNAPVTQRGRFDYEAELCAVLLKALHAQESPAFGYVLCNDFTDRWQLARNLDFDKPMGTTGFAAGKGGPGMMPLGPFLVVPYDSTAFYRSVTLELFLNGRLRQRASAALMIRSPEQIAEQALKTCAQDYHKDEETLRLTPCDSIPAGTILLTGTPEGVLFHPVTLWNPFAYLQAGDEVLVRAPWLGVLQNRIE